MSAQRWVDTFPLGGVLAGAVAFGLAAGVLLGLATCLYWGII